MLKYNLFRAFARRSGLQPAKAGIRSSGSARSANGPPVADQEDRSDGWESGIRSSVDRSDGVREAESSILSSPTMYLCIHTSIQGDNLESCKV